MESNDPKSLIFTQTLWVPIIRKELTNAIYTELNNIFPPIDHGYLFYIQSWDFTETERWIDFTLNAEYCFITAKTRFQQPTSEAYRKLQQEFNKDIKKVVKKLHSFVGNSYPFKIHIEILESGESGCVIKLVCYPFLYYNITTYKKQLDDLQKRNALILCEEYLQKLKIGLNAKDKSEYDIASLSSFLGINHNWMTSTLALQLQEVSITLVSKKKGIILDKPSVERILSRKIQRDEHFFSCKYQAFVKEAKRRYGVEIPLMANWLRKMRQAVLHEGFIPTESEREQVISATVSLLKDLRKLYEAKEISTNDSTTTTEK